MNILFLNIMPLAEGFGFNTNIFETNVINLAAVLGIVITFVGPNLTALLEDRKKTILNNLEEANQRALDAQEKLKFLFPKADYQLAAPDTSDYLTGTLKFGLKVVASPLIGLFKAAGAWNRVVNTSYLVARQAAQGEGQQSRRWGRVCAKADRQAM